MTAADMAQYLGQRGHITTGAEGLHVRVHVVDAKSSYGELRLRVSPTDSESHGAAWVDARRVVLDES